MSRVLAALLLLLFALLRPAAADELPGCASALHEWLQGRAEVLGRAVRDIDERQFPAAPAGGSGQSTTLVHYAFDEHGDLTRVISTSGRVRSREVTLEHGRRMRILERDEDGIQREFDYRYAPTGYHYVETETVRAEGQEARLRMRFWLARVPVAAAAARPPRTAGGSAGGHAQDGAAGGTPWPGLQVSPGIDAPLGFRDACLAQIVDAHDGSSTWSLKYVEYDSHGLDVASAAAAWPGSEVRADDPHAVWTLLDKVIAHGGIEAGRQPTYTQTRVSRFESPACQGTSLLTVTGDSPRDLQFNAGALEGYWVVLDAAGRVCLGRFGRRTQHYRYELDEQGNWTARQELVRQDGSGPDYLPGDRQERSLRYVGDSEGARQAEVAHRGAAVMPFDLHATVHVFDPAADGGMQEVRVRDGRSPDQLALVRSHLQEIRDQFLRGDWSAPGHIHGDDMPGLAELRAAPPGSISIDYAELADGAALRYRSQDQQLVEALHRWFEAQREDHGHDAMQAHHHMHMPADEDLPGQ